MDFFTRFTHEKNPQNNFSSQNFSVENNYCLIIAPEGCLQYFVNPEGYIKSFNFDMEQSPYPSDLDYSICIRRQQGFCGINLGVYTEGDGKIITYVPILRLYLGKVLEQILEVW